ncbi:Hypothetical predicted protein [Octopus vulgaris]|uniref:Uncharacterized protein n=1 Tax=Octopus vulgaris TaxID=6645 RepID=A0AA36BZB4_OCTVU|nr:Hypothetical predicted protein [Octopus vulgaris]
MKAHTLGESLILPAYKKIVKTMLGNYAAKEENRNLVSNDAVLRRILETSSNIEKTKKELDATTKDEDAYNISNSYLCKWQIPWKPCVGEALMAKALGDKLSEILNHAVEIVNYIKTRPEKMAFIRAVLYRYGFTTHTSAFAHRGEVAFKEKST